MSRPNRKDKIMRPLLRELEYYREEGIALYLDGRPSSPIQIARACTVAEGGGYMRDYTEDEEGHIAKVSFDYIEND